MKNILKQLWNRRSSNGWIAAEIVIVSVFLWFVIDLMIDRYDCFHRPMGFDIKDTYLIYIDLLPPSAEGYVSSEETGTSSAEDMIALLDRLRRTEGVEAMAAMNCARPYSPCNGTSMFMSAQGKDTLYYAGMGRIVPSEYFKVFRILTPEGVPAGQEYKDMLVLSKDLADSLQVRRGDSVCTQMTNWRAYPVGVCTEVRYAETWGDVANGYIVVSETKIILEGGWPGEICIRLRGGMNEEQTRHTWERIKAACTLNNLSFFYSTPFSEIRKEYLSYMASEVKTQSWYGFFLLVNIFLGVVGTFWFHTQRRRGEIGLRLAIGASRADIFRRLTGEGMMLLAVMMIPVFVIVANMWYMNVLSYGTTLWRFLLSGLLTWLLMALMIFGGIWYPSRKAMRIQPAEALHEE